jgi:hypothetical protein
MRRRRTIRSGWKQFLCRASLPGFSGLVRRKSWPPAAWAWVHHSAHGLMIHRSLLLVSMYNGGHRIFSELEERDAGGAAELRA